MLTIREYCLKLLQFWIEGRERRFGVVRGIYIEYEYLKDGIIFYRFMHSNIAVSRKLNHLDMSLLTSEELEVIATPSTDQSVRTYNEEPYLRAIEEWIETHSVPTGINKMIESYSGNRFQLESDMENINRIDKYLEIIADNKLTFKTAMHRYFHEDSLPGDEVTENAVIRKEVLDVTYELRLSPTSLTRGGQSIVLAPSDSNINLFDKYVGSKVYEDDDGMLYLRRATLVGLLIRKYNRVNTDTLREYNRKAYSCTGGNLYWNRYPEVLDRQDIAKHVTEDLDKLIGIADSWDQYTRSVCDTFRTLGYSYWVHKLNEIVIRLSEAAGPDNILIDIDYASMPDNHLLMLKKHIENLIKRNARPVQKELEVMTSILMYLPGRPLKGLKKTREKLTNHLQLAEMYNEIERRGIL